MRWQLDILPLHYAPPRLEVQVELNPQMSSFSEKVKQRWLLDEEWCGQVAHMLRVQIWFIRLTGFMNLNFVTALWAWHKVHLLDLKILTQTFDLQMFVESMNVGRK